MTRPPLVAPLPEMLARALVQLVKDGDAIPLPTVGQSSVTLVMLAARANVSTDVARACLEHAPRAVLHYMPPGWACWLNLTGPLESVTIYRKVM